MDMNTNGNVYTVIYSAVIVVLVAAILAFAAISLKPRQDANIKAETISQMLAAAQFFTKEELEAMGNDKVLVEYANKIDKAFLIDANGDSLCALGTDANNIEIADGLKAQNKLIKKGRKDLQLPVYIFNKDGKKISVVPVYGAGLWGPVWGYLAFDEDMKTILGAYFDHDSETPGLGAKIKDDPQFRAAFIGKSADFSADKIFSIVKGGAPEGKDNAIDAITGATMTSDGLGEAIDTWLKSYKPYFAKKGAAAAMTVVDPADSLDANGAQKVPNETVEE